MDTEMGYVSMKNIRIRIIFIETTSSRYFQAEVFDEPHNKYMKYVHFKSNIIYRLICKIRNTFTSHKV